MEETEATVETVTLTVEEFMAHIEAEVLPAAAALDLVVTVTPKAEYDEALRKARAMAEGGRSDYVAFPAWRYNPETGVGQVFDAPEDVPAGWRLSPF